MQPFDVPATRSTPAVQLDPQSGLARITGSSFPENASRFYQPVFDWIQSYCQLLLQQQNARLLLDLELVYLNSSSSKIMMLLFDLLEDTARQGADVAVIWRFHPENETAMECGEEFKEDLKQLVFTMQPQETSPHW